jgi:FkbM family methyltransferase
MSGAGRSAPTATIRAARERLGTIVSTALIRAAVRARLTMRVGEIRLRVSPTAMGRYLWNDRHAYDQQLAFCRRFLRPDDVVVDVGANIGLVTLTAAKLVGARGQVIAVEPHPRTFDYLRDNVQLNRLTEVVRLYCVALAERPGRRRIEEFPGDDSQNRMAVAENGGGAVPVETLDRLLALDRPISLLKVDVEGYERFVFDGAGRTLSVTGCIYFESWEPHFARYGYRGRDVFDGLRARGYRLYQLREDMLLTLTEDHVSAECENLVAVHDLADLLGRTRYRLGER